MSERDTIRNDIELSLEATTDGENSALVVHYLPEFGMRTGEIVGTEALVRWQHPTRGLLMPDSFIGVLESINVAGKLGRLVMRSACAQFGLWHSRGVGRDAVLRINVSPMEFVADNIVDTVTTTLDEFAIDPGAVCLEITERVMVQEIDTTRRTLARLKDIGVQIAIDDFGTGYSALTYLKTLPVDTLKIDRGICPRSRLQHTRSGHCPGHRRLSSRSRTRGRRGGRRDRRRGQGTARFGMRSGAGLSAVPSGG